MENILNSNAINIVKSWLVWHT